MLMVYFSLYLKNAGVVLMTNNFISDGREGKRDNKIIYEVKTKSSFNHHPSKQMDKALANLANQWVRLPAAAGNFRDNK